ncbi:MAG: hypothetical protein DWQ36_12040 [Acidobacteria bacterium]|nr:MAG: hypothetical protein DWQ30_25735 [Acidobacteriota bacterium]REK07276.1 MAG: hypothetical protein DWQ36_12040 [Acidobacteriota bacterium]
MTPTPFRRITRPTRHAVRPLSLLLVLLALLASALPAQHTAHCDDGTASPKPSAEATDATEVPGARSANLLGRVEFPNSGATEAQADFVQGVLYLHNFEYEDAAAAFRRAQEIDPGFALAYWGEAMTHNHPIWMAQDRDAANAVLARYAPSAEERLAKTATPRERSYLETLELLYGNLPATAELDKEQRDDVYRDALARLAEQYPEDHEARSFWALAILGSAHEGRDFATYMRAAATAMPVWERNPEHPGAAHYLIHSFDDPVHAPLGLPMAEAYAEIAPDAAHAQHMTSHIFVALGMWPEVIEANINAMREQNEAMARRGERDVVCGHYPYWLHYGYLQRGQLSRADELLTACQARIRNEPGGGERWHFAAMRARDVLDRDDPERVATWTSSVDDETPGARRMLFTDAWAALERGEVDRAGEIFYLMPDAALDRFDTQQHADIQVGQIEGLLTIARGRRDEGLAKLRAMAELESSLPFAFGPPEIDKPSWELLGEELLEAKRHADAAAAFERQLERTPRRTASLAGLVLASLAEGGALAEERARGALQELLEIWRDAEEGTPGLEAARDAAQQLRIEAPGGVRGGGDPESQTTDGVSSGPRP